MALISQGKVRSAKSGEWHKVDAFCLDKTEVTAGDYASCVKSAACASKGLGLAVARRDTASERDYGAHLWALWTVLERPWQ